MTAFGKKVNQIAARHGWNISPVSGWYIPAYSIVPMDRKERDQMGDLISSDREAAAFVMALDDLEKAKTPEMVPTVQQLCFA